MTSPCEYCGHALPLGTDRRTRATRTRHFQSCLARPKREPQLTETQRLEHNILVLKNALWKATGDDGDAVNAYIESEGGLLE